PAGDAGTAIEEPGDENTRTLSDVAVTDAHAPVDSPADTTEILPASDGAARIEHADPNQKTLSDGSTYSSPAMPNSGDTAEFIRTNDGVQFALATAQTSVLLPQDSTKLDDSLGFSESTGAASREGEPHPVATRLTLPADEARQNAQPGSSGSSIWRE